MGASVALKAVGTGMSVMGSMKKASDAKERAAFQSYQYQQQAIAEARNGVRSLIAAETNAEIRRMEGEMIAERYQTEADMIRAAAHRFRSRQTANAAARGVMVNEGSAQHLLDQTTMLAERDALVALNTGSYEQLMADFEASLIEERGDTAAAEGYARATEAGFNAGAAKIAGQSAARSQWLSAGTSLVTGAYDIYERTRPEPAGGAT